LKLGCDLSGTVVAIGDAVKDLKIGDEVFGCLLFQEMGMYLERQD
jgi:NADPH:quinone reductase-like Zn-dependent oxidoreductase